MAGPESSQLDHAQAIRSQRKQERFDRDASPEEKIRSAISEEVKRLLPVEVAKAIAAEFAKVQITGVNGCTVSGKFPVLTISMQINLTGSGTCDGNGNMVITIDG